MANVNAYKSHRQLPIASKYVFSYEILELPSSTTSATANSGASYTFIITMCISLGISLLTGGSMELMWSLANTLQILFFYSFMNLYYFSDLVAVFSFMSYSNFDNPVTKYVSKVIIGGISLIKSPVNSNFSGAGFNSTDIISNSFDKILIVLFMIWLMFLLV